MYVREPALAVMGGSARHRRADAPAAGRQEYQEERAGRPDDQAAGSPRGSSMVNEAPPSATSSARSEPPSSVTIP